MSTNIIHSIAFAPFYEVATFFATPDNKAEVVVSSWTDLEMHPASGELSWQSRNTDSGKVYTINASARLKGRLTVRDKGIMRIELCSGKVYIIGTPDYPISIDENTNINLTKISLSYTSYTPPLELAF